MVIKSKKKIYIGIFAIALILCILSPLLASSNPDGLEASAEALNPSALDSPAVINAPLPDYNIPGMTDNPLGGMACLILGTVISCGLVYGVFYVTVKHDN